eukprot:4169935-Alexandrium_andersonii.AAC.1
MSGRPSGAHARSAGPPPAGTGRPHRQSPRGPAPRPLAVPVPLRARARGSWPSTGTTTYKAESQ